MQEQIAFTGSPVRAFLPVLASQLAPFPQSQISASQRLPAEALQLERIRTGGILFSLRRPVRIEISNKDGSWYCENMLLSILACGATLQKALISFQEDFAVFWEEIAQSPDEGLTTGALAVKRAFLDLVSSAELD